MHRDSSYGRNVAMDYDPTALRRMMKAQHLTEQQLADAAGLGPRTINYIVRGVTEPRAGTLGKLARALKVSPQAFYRRPVKSA